LPEDLFDLVLRGDYLPSRSHLAYVCLLHSPTGLNSQKRVMSVNNRLTVQSVCKARGFNDKQFDNIMHFD